MEYKAFRKEFNGQIRHLSHYRLKSMAKELKAVLKARYDCGKPPKNENVEHGFTLEEFRRLLDAVPEGEFRDAFTLIGILGLRPNELVRLRGRDVLGGRLLIPSSKGGFELDLHLPPALLSLIPASEEDEKLFFKAYSDGLADKSLLDRLVS